MEDIEAQQMEQLVPTKDVKITEKDDEAHIENGIKKMKAERNFFSLKASILSLWVPCVVGKTDYSFLLISLTSFTVRTLAFILSLFLAFWNILPSGTFIVHCSPKSSKITL